MLQQIKTEIRPQVFNKGHKNAMVTLYTPNLNIYAKHSLKNFKKYCSVYNITLYIFNESLSDEVEHGCWNKIPAILYLLNNTKHEYIIWIDIDAVFNRLDINFSKYYKKYDKSMILCKDIQKKHKFNSGVMIIKNNNWSKKIFNDTWNTDIRHGYGKNGDQVILKTTIIKDGKGNNNYDKISGNKNVKLLPEREFNSYPRSNINNLDESTDNDFIIHYMGHDNYVRAKKISDINKKLKI